MRRLDLNDPPVSVPPREREEGKGGPSFLGQAARYLGQAVLYAVFVGLVGYFSTSPAYTLRGEEEAVLKLAVSHAGQILQPCRERTPEELAQLAPNMRVALDCPRERSAVEIELEMDGKLLYRGTAAPTGLARDGVSSVYRRFAVPSGAHELRARLKDHVALKAFNYVKEERVVLQAGEVLVVDFSVKQGGFVFR